MGLAWLNGQIPSAVGYLNMARSLLVEQLSTQHAPVDTDPIAMPTSPTETSWNCVTSCGGKGGKKKKT